MTKEKFAWSGLGIPLSWLVELDNFPAPNALADAFGDRYLYRHNIIFRSVRDAAIGFGYRFSSEDTPLWRDYQSFSLIALHRILSTRTIPYLDTAIAFRRLLEANPAARLPAGFIAGNVKHNHAFHESAHCVAHSIMQRNQTGLLALAPAESDRFVLESILAESFANTVESLGSVIRHLPLSDSVFYSLNSYFTPDTKREEGLHKAAAGLDARLRFTLMFLSFFEANLAAEPPGDATYERIAESAGCPSADAPLAREITDIGFRLSAAFRENTTPAYFELLGYAPEYTALRNSAWLSNAANRDFVLELTQQFREAAGSL